MRRLSSRSLVNRIAKAPPSGPPRPGAARRKAGPWRAQLASTPGREAALSGGAASPLERLQSVHYGPPSDQTPTREELFIYSDLGSSISAIVNSPHNAAAPPALPDMLNTAYNIGYDGIDHPLWLARHTGLIYTELDTVGNVRRLHADSVLHADGATGDLGGYSYSAFGKAIAPSAPGGLPDPSVSQPFRWQGKRLIAPNLYDSRARTWSADLGAFLQPDEYVFLSRGGTLWSWPGQNPMRWRDPSGRDAAQWFLGHTGWIDDVAPALAAAGAESGVPGLAQVGEAALLAISAIDAVSALDAQRQSAVAIAKATSDDGEQCENAHSKEPRELPTLDATGKVHGPLPEAGELDRYAPEDLEQLSEELQKSVQERIRKTNELGSDKAHGERQSAEQQLIRQIEKYLQDRQ